ncbi:PPE family protein [Mycobacterium haemophilum]|uniref:PPE family protein n=1 Tax=Mycobacterium haemophilum TaxID=29311 RepID=UPI00069C2574|nr:PPE family protein [Mycobacterium haemophilum]ALL56262.1 hypothetical protein B586_14190 [Mycobacterium haemophilum DSM 44634]MCV7341580.1 PPE family protein [Mycobacterium haemophilum DSM 44634]
MFFDSLPPEIISAKMYTGAGPDSMFAAAAEWENTCYAMRDTVGPLAAAVAVLQEQWLGASAIGMAEAAAPYRQWLDVLCWQIYRTAEQAYRLVEAYSDARQMVVSPEAIAWNRTQFQALIAADMFGENASAIAAVENQYHRFWAWNVKVMEAYAAAVADRLSKITPWPEPPEITSEVRVALGGVAVRNGC